MNIIIRITGYIRK